MKKVTHFPSLLFGAINLNSFLTLLSMGVPSPRQAHNAHISTHHKCYGPAPFTLQKCSAPETGHNQEWGIQVVTLIGLRQQSINTLPPLTCRSDSLYAPFLDLTSFWSGAFLYCVRYNGWYFFHGCRQRN